MKLKKEKKFFLVVKKAESIKEEDQNLSIFSSTSTSSQLCHQKPKTIVTKINEKKKRIFINKRYRNALKKISSISKIVLAQDTSSLPIILSSLHSINPDLIQLIFKKQKYFLSLLSTKITQKDMSLI
jgi:hypothetical protein